MSPESERAMEVLERVARGHPGASSGERAAWAIRENLRDGTPVDFYGGVCAAGWKRQAGGAAGAGGRGVGEDGGR